MSEEQWTRYQRILDFLRLRKRAYQLAFSNRNNSTVLKDLAKFCYANKTPRCTDLYRLGVAAGRREVWLRIQEHLNLQPDELYELYNQPSQQLPKE